MLITIKGQRNESFRKTNRKSKQKRDIETNTIFRPVGIELSLNNL